MLALFILALIIIIIAIASHWFIEEDYHLVHLGCIVLCIIAWWGITKINDNINGQMVHKVEKIQVAALVDSKEIEGAFANTIFIGSGYVNEKLYYYYIEQSERGKRVQKLPADDGSVYIREIPDGQPQLIKEYDIREHCSDWSYSSLDIKPKNVIYIFEVPNDTVTTQFSVDLK